MCDRRPRQACAGAVAAAGWPGGAAFAGDGAATARPPWHVAEIGAMHHALAHCRRRGQRDHSAAAGCTLPSGPRLPCRPSEDAGADGCQPSAPIAAPSHRSQPTPVPDRFLDVAPRQGRAADDSRPPAGRPRAGSSRAVGRGGQHDDRDSATGRCRRSGRPASAAAASPGPRPNRLAGEAAATTTSAVASESRTIPPRYRNGEYSLVRQTSTAMTTSPAAPGAVEDPPARRSATSLAQAAARPDQGQRRADQQGEGPGVGAVVDPGRIVAGLVEQCHRHGGGGRQQPARRSGQPGTADAGSPRAADQRRPSHSSHGQIR